MNVMSVAEESDSPVKRLASRRLLRQVVMCAVLAVALGQFSPQARADGETVAPIQPWSLINTYLSCDFQHPVTFATSYPGDSAMAVLQQYIDAENASCKGQQGTFFDVAFSLNSCASPNVQTNGDPSDSFGVYGGCTYHLHVTPNASCPVSSGICNPWDADQGAPSPIKICTSTSTVPASENGSLFTWPPGECECPAGTTLKNGKCLPIKIVCLKCDNLTVGNPISPGTGNKRQEEVDYSGGGLISLRFTRTYNSLSQLGSHSWTTSFDRSIVFQRKNDGLAIVTLKRADASYSYLGTSNGSNWVGDADVNYQVIGYNGSFRVTTPDGKQFEYYDGNNRLASVATASNGVEPIRDFVCEA